MVVNAQAMSIPVASLHAKAMLTRCPIGMWRGLKSDKAIRDAGAQAHGADPKMFTASKRLVAEDWIKRLEARRAHYRAEWARLTAPWLDDGTRIALGAGFVPLKQKISEFQDEWRDLVNEFVVQYPYLREDARVTLGPRFNINDYPDPNTIRERFYFRFTAFSLPDPSVTPDWRSDGLTQADLDQIKADAETTLREAIAAAQADAWARLRDPLAKMAERLANYTGGRDGSFQHTLISNLADVLDVLPAINLTADPLLDNIGTLARQLTLYTAQELREDETVRLDSAKLAADMVAQIDDFV